MLFELESVFNNEGFSLPVCFDVDFSQVQISGVCPFTTPVRVIGNVYNRAEVVHFDAEAEFTVEIPCDRCLTQLKRDFCIPINHVLVTQLNDEENDELILIDSYSYDFEPLVSEDVFLNLPSLFLCKEDCKGLCADCGKNLNDGPCSCEKPIDPRLEALKQLLDSDN